MRKLLDGLYRFSSFMAGLLVVFIFLIILVQIAGRRFGVAIPSANELAGFAMAGATFFALAPTLRAGAHIRVSVLLGRLRGRIRQSLEALACTFCLLAAGYATYHLGVLVWNSYRFGDLAPGLLPLPLWIPQSLLALGMGVFTLALADALWSLLHGELPPFLRESRGAE
ncbi:MAG: TRAP transporter small permease [Meiothermus sp.]